MDENMRGDLGSYYTSEENILKVINPLFMDNLREEYNQALKKSSKKDKKYYLEKLLEKMGNLKFFDPACGSGNFLIVTYRELRLLEYKILEKIRSLESNIKKWKDKQTILIPGSITKIKIENFYGIEIDEFSSKIAQVSMWFIEHQMNLKYESLDLHEDNLPLKQYVNIKNENSLRMDWKEVVQPDNNVYIIGNPPFGGKQNQNKEQKEDMKLVFKGFKNIGTLDYVTAWYKKALDYMKGTKIESAFVSTNSICQGEQVPNLWIQLRKKYDDFYINFAHQTFRWKNEAKKNASVFCVIIGFSFNERNKKFLYTYEKPTSLPEKHEVSQINSYLLDMDEIVPEPKKYKPICDVPKIEAGSMPNDGGNLIIKNEKEKNKLIKEDSRIEKYIHRLATSEKYIKGEVQYCLWFKDDLNSDLSDVLKISVIKERIENVKNKRLKSTRKKTRQLAEYPQLFGEIRLPENKDDESYIFFPATTTENREYIPLDLIDQEVITNNSAFIISSSSKYLFGILSSKINMIWIKFIGGKLGDNFRYSTTLYNDFPFPDVSCEDKVKVVECVQEILDIRKESKKTLFDLYDPETMPLELKKAHKKLDKEVEKLYKSESFYEKGVFTNEESTLKFLLKLYEYKKNNN
ncbi:class I SAM-dependent DNA methyltransferase [Methanosphaera cuniculi]|nr:DNA methyltransferase [Methanosphaera cuniculi]